MTTTCSEVLLENTHLLFLKLVPFQTRHVSPYERFECADIWPEMDIRRRPWCRGYDRVKRPWNVLSMSTTLPSETAAQVIASCLVNKLLRGFRGDKVH